MVVSAFLTPEGAPGFGWTAYTPLSNLTNTPAVGANLWIMGLVLSGFGTILGAVNMIATIVTLRAPGMTMFRMPIFTWNILVTAVLVLMAFPILAAALLALLADRVLGAHVYDVATGGPLLWQHLFWFFGHPEVYIVALPFFGIVNTHPLRTPHLRPRPPRRCPTRKRAVQNAIRMTGSGRGSPPRTPSRADYASGQEHVIDDHPRWVPA
jgi:heme/copper-type cytochrome/quinol oxidase subunit 1